MLEKEKFLEIKSLAKKTRKKNEKQFKKIGKDDTNDAIREKDELVSSLVESVSSSFDEGEKGKEERQIFRANVLIPNDVEFFQAYSKDKNIRNLMNKYAVNIEDVMGKITELNLYGKYIDVFAYDEPSEEDKEIPESKPEEKPKEDMQSNESEKSDFTQEMVDLTSKEAESLLSEIEDLSNNIDSVIETDAPADDSMNEEISLEDFDKELAKLEETQVISNIPDVDDIVEEPSVDKVSGEELDDISDTVSDFVNEYTRLKGELERTQKEKDKLQSELDSTKESLACTKDRLDKSQSDYETLLAENAELKQNNLDSSKEIQELSDTKKQLENDNAMLNNKVKTMQEKINKSVALIRKIYSGMPKKNN